MSVPERDPRTRPRLTSAIRRLAVDIEPLRVSRDFRLIWTGLLVSELGYQFTLVATFIQVKDLTGSAAAVGGIGLVGLIALVAGTLAGSSFVDLYDRRKILIWSQLGYMAGSGILFVGALHGRPPVALVYAGVAVIAAVSAVDGPTRSAMTPRLVGRELLPSALALSQVIWNGTALVGPALGGVVIATGGRQGLAIAYGVDLVTYGAVLAAAFLIRPMPPERDVHAPRGFAAVREGFAYLRGRRVLQSTFAADLIAMIFGMPRALFPFLAASQFHAGSEVAGLLFSAPAVGALLGALGSGWVGRVRHQGKAVLLAVALWGLGITAFGLVGDHLWLALGLLAFAGGSDVISAVFRNTILQLSVPDALRGRISSIHILVVTGGPRLGDLEAGLVAQAFSPAASVISGGILCLIGTALLAMAVPELRRYHAGEMA
ncbi:MAG: MFS transporter [Candidatus Velamenicoccus archaeovorus]